MSSAHYGQSPYAGGSSSGGFNSLDSDSPLNKIREYTSKVEDLIDQYTQPIKPHLPALGRFLIVVTFLEDALRIVTQWSDQKYYLQKHRGFPWGISHIFLLTNVLVSKNSSKRKQEEGEGEELFKELRLIFCFDCRSCLLHLLL